ncbi:hypothetical protein MMC25_003635 [Agyrium rufum]|nr:hypothetical protein [Agyrium rufum]
MAMATAAIALFVVLGIPQSLATGGSALVQMLDSALLIWGAASSIEASAVQLARSMCFTIFTTASSQHYHWFKKLGVTEILDHYDPDIVTKLAELLKLMTQRFSQSLILSASVYTGSDPSNNSSRSRQGHGKSSYGNAVA